MRIAKPGPVSARQWTPVTLANGALALLLEGGILVSLFLWGLHTGTGTFTGILIGLGSAVLAGVVWGAFLAAGGPKYPLPAGPEIALKLAVFAVAALALSAVANSTAAWIFAALSVLSVAVEYTAVGPPAEPGPAAQPGPTAEPGPTVTEAL
ncbi:YrdB family protein [Streptomyces sp. NPDC051561]|uniref:YrdB family protein n=1 Tax=Streptomyces sp. NPDC051561 TaxID=3365658 RepID=UPI0037AB57D6